MTWQKLLSSQIGIAFLGVATYLATTSHWLLWALFFCGWISGAVCQALEQAHRRAS